MQTPGDQVRLKGQIETVKNMAEDFRSTFSGSKVLVTGGAGFLGSWLCEALAACGEKHDWSTTVSLVEAVYRDALVESSGDVRTNKNG